jgi:hypothetical protein
VGSWAGRMTDSEGEHGSGDRGMDETEAGIPLITKWYIYWVVCLCCITKETE